MLLAHDSNIHRVSRDNAEVSEHTLVLCACGSEGEASEIATLLITRNLAACVNISAPVRSIYRWQGKVESTEEWLLTIKTVAVSFAELSAAIQSVHSYELPEIIAIPITDGFPPYLKWIEDSVHE
jgi:periplasmic divalent cation tolerance protein